MTVNDRWFGTLNAENVDAVAEVIREMLSRRFCIAEALYCDSTNADLRLISPACALNSEWVSEPYKEPVRVFKDGDRPWIGFSAGNYLWQFCGRADGNHDHEDYHYPYFSFEYDRFMVTERAPAGKGYLHKRVFGRIEDTKEQS